MCRQVTAGGSCIFLCVCHAETPLFFIAENQSKYFWWSKLYQNAYAFGNLLCEAVA
jgi:hypothetical protein